MNRPRLIPSGIAYNPVLPDYRYIENDSFLPVRVRGRDPFSREVPPIPRQSSK